MVGATGVIGGLYIKADHALPIAGSVKARGGLYEVLIIAERLAAAAGLITNADSSLALASPRAQQLFSNHTISVGSTGNLGLCVGIAARVLGFRAVVHISADAKRWKKDRLANYGVTVIEHGGHYAAALHAGRAHAESDPSIHFIDDENSLHMFLGYSVAAKRLESQLKQARLHVDSAHPLFVYLPCGVGGAPGGITFGLKHVFGDAVHCFFAEPVQAPSMLLQLSSGLDDSLSTDTIGLYGRTEADGLAVAAASLLAARLIRHLVSGIFTVVDESLFHWVHLLHHAESIKLEPSAVAGFSGPHMLLHSDQGREYLRRYNLPDQISQSSHILWSTGGSLVPDAEFDRYRQRGADLQNRVEL